MSNNPAVIDAIIAGAGGGAQTAWLVTLNPNDYNSFAIAVNAIATAVDALIPPINPGPSLSQINLLKCIASAVCDGRYLVASTPSDYSDIASRIVILYSKLKVGLNNIPDVYATSSPRLPNNYVETSTPTGTNSLTLVDVPGMTTVVNLTYSAYIAVMASFVTATQGGASASTIGVAIGIDGVDHDLYYRFMSGTTDQGIGAIVHRSDTALAIGPHTVKLRYLRQSGVSVPGINRADMLVMAI